MTILPIVLASLTAFVGANWIHPYILRIARNKNIVDNPDARKLQRIPIPVMGGVSVVFGILIGSMCFNLFGDFDDMFPILVAMMIMMLIGLIDDIIELSPKIRFIAEILVVLALIYTTNTHINDFRGLWGCHIIPNTISVPLTIFASVGIINAINLIDGVDGYSSGYCIVACILFGVMFHFLGDIKMVALATMTIGALIPFFFHNVFGKYSKMFIGDAGTLAMGIIMSAFVAHILSAEANCHFIDTSLGLIPFTLAVMCIPVFDTLRVMSTRIARHHSPFHPDKTHLHHLFIDLGFSHIGTTISIICINLFVVLCWFFAYKLGASIDLQLYIVIGLGILVTFVFYWFMRRQIRNNGKAFHFMQIIGRISHVERKGIWATIQRWLDSGATTV